MVFGTFWGGHSLITSSHASEGAESVGRTVPEGLFRMFAHLKNDEKIENQVSEAVFKLFQGLRKDEAIEIVDAFREGKYLGYGDYKACRLPTDVEIKEKEDELGLIVNAAKDRVAKAKKFDEEELDVAKRQYYRKKEEERDGEPRFVQPPHHSLFFNSLGSSSVNVSLGFEV